MVSTSACRVENNFISTSCKPLTPPTPRSAAPAFPSPRKKTDHPNQDHENILSHSTGVSLRVFHHTQVAVAPTTAVNDGRGQHSLSRSPPCLPHRTLRRSE